MSIESGKLLFWGAAFALQLLAMGWDLVKCVY